MARVACARNDGRKGISSKSREKQSGAFGRWVRFLQECNISDPFLSDYKQVERNCIISAFAHSVRHNEFGRTAKATLRGGTVESTINHVAASFREEGFKDPSLDPNGKKHLCLSRMIKGYKESDPKTSKQPCLPMKVFMEMCTSSRNKKETITALLCLGALFFAMRSCEYLNVNKDSSKQDRKTKLLQVKNFKFSKHNKPIPISNTSKLQTATSVSITFESQKNKHKFETITLHSTQTNLCPVKIWSKIITTILASPGGSINSNINFIHTNNKHYHITSEDMRIQLRRSILKIGESNLGIKATEVGTHSIRTTFAMILLLNKVNIPTIMKLGRWKSTAVLEYVRENIDRFSKNISTHFSNTDNNDFFNLPSFIAAI